MPDTRKVWIVGAGLAGSEAALLLARAGLEVRLIEMKRQRPNPAQHSQNFAELVCSNSLRSTALDNANGLLKEELSKLGSPLLSLAQAHAVPAGQALAVDREAFSRAVTEAIEAQGRIHVEEREVLSLGEFPAGETVLVAAGPLCAAPLFADLEARFGQERLAFFDAAAPLIEASSINYDIAFFQSRYDKGGADYLNCPLNREEYLCFLEALLSAEKAEVKDFDQDLPVVFESCMPIEVMAARGEDAIRFGPMRPVGLRDPRSGKRPYAVVQLRKDNATASLYNMVGFQTRLKFPEQRRVFRLIPGLEEAEFARYGVMHRNCFLNSPAILGPNLAAKKQPELYFAGQLIGLEGYMQAVASGLLAAYNILARHSGEADFICPPESIIGSLQRYLVTADAEHFQPMNANFGLLPAPDPEVHKRERRACLQARAQRRLDEYLLQRSGLLTKMRGA